MNLQGITRALACACLQACVLVTGANVAVTQIPSPNDTEESTEPIFTEGVFFGSIRMLDEETMRLEVESIRSDIGPRVFHLDRRTRYYVDDRRRPRSALQAGHRVAVYFIARNRFAIVKRVFVVFGEFKDAETYKRSPRKKKRRRSK